MNRADGEQGTASLAQGRAQCSEGSSQQRTRSATTAVRSAVTLFAGKTVTAEMAERVCELSYTPPYHARVLRFRTMPFVSRHEKPRLESNLALMEPRYTCSGKGQWVTHRPNLARASISNEERATDLRWSSLFAIRARSVLIGRRIAQQ